MSRSKILALVAATAMIPLAACSTTGSDMSALDMFPEERQKIDPSDNLLLAAVQQYLVKIDGPKNSQFEYVRKDLNGDGLREGIVMFNLPHTYWCGWSGCTMAIFEAQDNDWALVSETKGIRGPVVVSENTSNQWEDINVRVSGTGSADRTVTLRYDGFKYPQSPLDLHDEPYDIAAMTGVRFFP